MFVGPSLCTAVIVTSPGTGNPGGKFVASVVASPRHALAELDPSSPPPPHPATASATVRTTRAKPAHLTCMSNLPSRLTTPEARSLQSNGRRCDSRHDRPSSPTSRPGAGAAPGGVEPPHAASKAAALSAELRGRAGDGGVTDGTR